MDKIFDNNKVTMCGEIASSFVYSHDVFGEGFYLFDLKVVRLSETADIIPVMISERLIDVDKNYIGAKVRISGQFRSYNKRNGQVSKLFLSVFATDISFYEDYEVVNVNEICLNGFICKQPIYRKTPFGREISDVLLAVNRPYGKSDYIPCIVWGRNARYVAELEVGQAIKVSGRIQSRIYHKRIEDAVMEERIAYEVSVGKVEVVENA